jgi:hexosaminidase
MGAEQAKGVATELRLRGYAVLPAPRRVELRDGALRLAGDLWHVRLDGVGPEDIAFRTLTSGLEAEYGLRLPVNAKTSNTLRLAVRPGAVQTGLAGEREGQAYRLTVTKDAVEVVGNDRAGLFYGVQTLLQLLEGDGRQPLTLPLGEIDDWPQFQLRIVHWDTKHHQDRPETLRRYLDWCARFKVNAVAFELEDKFEYPSHPVIGAPGAFTTEELQDLVDYGLERHIQIIPDVQAPAHLAYVLKHPAFAHLRCDGSNYQICMDEPEAVKVLFEMYDDVCNATKGVPYFLVSTDEVYYAGICEKFRKPYNPANRSLTWVDYVNKAHAHLAAKGRRVIVWGEYPLLAEHVRLLPPDLIDGVIGEDEYLPEESKRGIRQLAYCSMQGSEKLFPNVFPYEDASGRLLPGNLAAAAQNVLTGRASRGNPIGTFAAAWDDSGLHSETFWLGWAAMAQNGWTPGAAPVEQTAADFMDLYYGRSVVEMAEVYRGLQTGARFWEAMWERQPSKVRGMLYGNSYAKKPIRLSDLTLTPPALPTLPDLACAATFRESHARLLAEAPKRLRDNEWLLARLQANFTRATRNRYNLEVLLSLAYFERHGLDLLVTLGQVEDLLSDAAAAHQAKDRERAVGLLVQAHRQVGRLIEGLHETYGRLKRVWEKSRYPKGRSHAGRDFVHVFDDVKDHWADRRPDLSYLIAPEESIGLAEWQRGLARVIAGYAKAAGVAMAPLAEPRLED